MIPFIAVVHAVISIVGGALGAKFTNASMGSGIVAVAIGYLALWLSQYFGANLMLSSLVYLVVMIAVGFALKLTPRQIAGVVIGAFVASFIGGFVLGFVTGFENAFYHRTAA
ncbi:hypothetical protein [Oryzicola mucosus]|uniref:Uncharacterized protein n=1 Tax=Oryzicola mucosus TaxID=2767425 RepID=A0A8J6U0P9_9HYPH|nr:hypothetical protein [Oryzicola mucosus]MBD0415916.1 hypothetical protein [Oryzicola mucosus]